MVFDSGFSIEGRQQGFTTDRTRLHKAVDTPFMGWTAAGMQPTAAGLAHGNPLAELETSPDCLCGLCVFDALENTANAMLSVRTRQKVLLFIGQAILIQDPPSTSGPCSIRPNRERALRALDLANVTVHTLDPTGLDSLATTAEYRGGTDRPPSSRENLIRQGDLAVIPDHTGGRTVLNTNAPEQLIPAIFRETRAYYVLGFQRANPTDDGKVREIKVRVNRPGAIVRARSAYYAPLPETRARPIAPLDAAVAGGLPETSIPLSLALTPFAIDDKTGAVAVQLRVPPSVTERRFEAQSTILDGRGHVVKSEQYTVTFDAPHTDPVTLLTHLDLKPGQYEVRVAAKSGDRTASVYGYVDVPSMHADRMWVSELLIEDGSTPVAPSLERSQVLSATPTARRTFDPSDPIVVAFQVRRPEADKATPAESVSVRMRVLDDHDRVGAESTLPLPASASAGLTWLRMLVPLARLSPGEHLVEVIVGTGAESVTRRLRLAVR